MGGDVDGAAGRAWRFAPRLPAIGRTNAPTVKRIATVKQSTSQGNRQSAVWVVPHAEALGLTRRVSSAAFHLSLCRFNARLVPA